MDRIQLRFGQAVGLKELVATLVVSGVLLIVGTVVFAKVKSSMGDSIVENSTADTTIDNVETTAYDAFETPFRVDSQVAKFGNSGTNSACSSCNYRY